MSNVLEFYLKMKDLMSSGLAKVAKTGKDSFGALDKYVGTVYNSVERTSRGVERLSGKLRDAQGRFAAMNKEAQRSSSAVPGFLKGLGGASMLGRFANPYAMAALAVTAGVTMAGAGGISSIGKAMDFGKTNTSFEVLTGSKEKGQGLANSLNKLQQDTILGPEVFQNAQTMLGFGVATEKVLPTMKMLGDVSMGNADKLQALTLAFSQTTAAGKMTGQDLLQYVNAGFNPLKEISDMTGKSMAVLKQQMEAGAITTSMVEEAFKHATSEGGKFNHMMDKIAETPAGKLAQLQGQFESFQIQVGQALMPLASIGLSWLQQMLPLAQQVIPYITAGVQYISDFITSISNGTSGWSAYLDIAKQVILGVWSVLKYVWQFVSYIVTDLMKWIKSSELLKDLFWAIQKVLEFVWWVVKNIVYTLQWVYQNTIKPILEGIEKAYRWIKGLLGGKTDVEVTQKTVAEVTGVTPTSAIGSGTGTTAPTKQGSSTDALGKAVTSGGPRVININGVKFMDKLELHTATFTEGAQSMERALQEMFLRILNSGASVQ